MSKTLLIAALLQWHCYCCQVALLFVVTKDLRSGPLAAIAEWHCDFQRVKSLSMS